MNDVQQQNTGGGGSNIFIGILILLAVLVIGLLIANYSEKPIGGERDEYGCLGPAGYSYIENLGICAREWELEKTEDISTAVEYLLNNRVDSHALTYVSTVDNEIQFDRFQKIFTVSMENGEVLSVNISGIYDFQTCADAGNPIMESYPSQCRNEDEIFTQDIGNELEKMDLIRINNPRPNQLIKSPLDISGEARGTWFFEGDFPVVLVDWDGLIIAEGYVSAEDDWMTEDFVPYSGTLEFDVPEYGERGALILRKDNPSGLPENDDALEIPVKFE